MSKFQDKFNLWHDRECRNGEPRSNNWMIYTAYAKALGLHYGDTQGYFKKCTVKLTRDNITINRHPNKKHPPLSFDECLGAIYLDLMPYGELKANHFVYFGHGKPLGKHFFERLVLAMIEAMAPKIIVRGFSVTVKKAGIDDRNAWWKHNLQHVKHFAARLNPAQTYIVKKFFGKKYHNEEEKLWAFFRDSVEKKRAKSHQEHSTRNLLWLMHLMNGSEHRARKIKPWVSFEAYFGKLHPFTIAIKKKYNV